MTPLELELVAALEALADEARRVGQSLCAKGQGATVLGMRELAARKLIAKARAGDDT